ncbi:proline synthetase associated protein [Gracilaria domingensis]|nr:proline synthetase associated protein [Gracilaria domingensis]KAI0559028.1 proline synthetase associated protein [Gracilaria domingensis]KAI0561728.1 proline synthetase associated protein [Gracilaria domingensis]
MLPSLTFNSALRTSRIAVLTARRTQYTTMSAELSLNATAACDVATALENVRGRIRALLAGQNERHVELVAVSKTKPVELLKQAYNVNQRHFGENYVQELVQKAALMPDDVKWHFIGSLQSNKAKHLLTVPNLFVVESVDRQKTASALHKAAKNTGRNEKLNVMVQVNTSGEDSKSGCQPGQTADLAAFVVEQCDALNLVGVMTIGAFDTSDEPEAFRVLAGERDRVADRLKWDKNELKLSMGMSADFEAAIKMGSDSVRVGSTIFGERQYPNK